MWMSSDGQHQNQIIFFVAKNGEALYSQQKQDLELTVAQSFRYDLNQIPHDYTVEVTSTFKGLNLADRVPEKLWTKIHSIV